MGQSKSKENDDLTRVTHFSENEINALRHNVKQKDQDNITEDVFKNSVKQCVPTVSNNDDIFLKRLYAAFGGNKEKSIDFRKFVDGLSVFIKGTPEEKLQLSFKLYDVDKDEFISKEELEKVMLELSHIFSEEDDKEDQSKEVQDSIDCMFQDFDIDGDGKLSFEEYKLSSMKEPIIADYIESFLDRHNLSNKPKQMTSRPTSVSSKKSLQTPPLSHQRRSSYKLSQSELLDYSHQLKALNITDTPSPQNQSPRNSSHLPLTPVEYTSGTQSEGTTPPSTRTHRRLSRGGSMASLDAAMISM